MQGDGDSRPIDEAELRQELERLSPFHHDIALPYGLRTDMPELPGGGGQHTRVQTLVQHGFPALVGEYGAASTAWPCWTSHATAAASRSRPPAAEHRACWASTSCPAISSRRS